MFHDNSQQDIKMTEQDTQTSNKTQAAQRFQITRQYIQDLSFENPSNGAVLSERPELQIHVNIDTQKLETNNYRVSLKFNINANTATTPLFLTELVYSGEFIIENFASNVLSPMLYIECPRLLFPFARSIIADVTRDGGFAPIVLDPIDFVTMYQQQVERQKQASMQSAGNA